jgi:uncharacterized membrane protein YfcA
MARRPSPGSPPPGRSRIVTRLALIRPLESTVMWTHLLFLIFVALAVYAQTLTEFALALILLGLIGATDLMPLIDAVNAVTVIVLTAAITFLYRRWPLQLERPLWPAAASSVVGTVAGVIVLTSLAGAAYEVLRLLLGLSIVFCALLLWRAAKPRKAVSSRGAFVLDRQAAQASPSIKAPSLSSRMTRSSATRFRLILSP